MRNIAYSEREPWLSHDPRVYLMYTARARELQSETIARGFGAAGRFLARTATAAIRSIIGNAAQAPDDGRAVEAG